MVGAYLSGAIAGATLTAILAWLLSGFLEPLGGTLRAALLCVGALFVWAAKDGPLVGRMKLPEARRQIPMAILAASLVRGAYRFGFEMGTGMRTYVPSFAPYVLLLTLIVARPSVGQALLIAVGFGLGRAIPLMVHLGREDRRLMTRDFLRGSVHRLAGTASGLVILLGGLMLV
ncbi:MAG: hypothetical protein M3O70_15975 [Actinomycetota bacterium]|nr:hypothetical protein [Actinomycetota bacterium]